ncbi:hypothetical protein AMS68_000341 [Peltaster fructicola]|uniref:Methyltransferase type 11 domain-containing protein n=1 Tax=Peltaster fructicola TaxID=286661 RepID=A0A6H0XJD2_9PEZI|nr:hypothetical protein AMS68_000341 [Peltaster fructicola]
MAQQADPTPLNLLTPFVILAYSVSYLPVTIYQLLLERDFKTLLNFEALKSAWFARFWAFFGPKSRDRAEPKITPLIQNQARGVCLDIGPGSGQWLYLFAQAMNPTITKIYGVEPNIGMHAALRENAVKAGLGDVYEIIGCGAQELITKGGLQPESVDTIITVQCLCSIPSPQTNIRELYPLLRHGGKWLVYEHIKTKYQRHFVGYWQHVINVVWPHFLGGCSIVRPTDVWLQDAGKWQEVNLRPGPGEGPYDTIPHVIGYLRK